jgi:hypothetical protein
LPILVPAPPPVLDDGLLAPDFRELLGNDAGDKVCRSSRGKRHNEAHDSIGPIQRLRLRPRGTIAKAEREGGPGGQSNQAAAREHDYLLAAFILSEPRTLAHSHGLADRPRHIRVPKRCRVGRQSDFTGSPSTSLESTL